MKFKDQLTAIADGIRLIRDDLRDVKLRLVKIEKMLTPKPLHPDMQMRERKCCICGKTLGVGTAADLKWCTWCRVHLRGPGWGE